MQVEALMPMQAQVHREGLPKQGCVDEKSLQSAWTGEKTHLIRHPLSDDSQFFEQRKKGQTLYDNRNGYHAVGRGEDRLAHRECRWKH